MENQTSLIAQDPLTLAIQDAQEAKKVELERKSREKREARESELAKIEMDMERTLTRFLIQKFNIRNHMVEDILSNKNTRLKVCKMTLKSLILRRAALSLHSVSCGVITFFSLRLFYTGIGINFEQVGISDIVIGIFGGSFCIIGVILYLCSHLRPSLLKRISLGDKILTFRRFFKIIKCLRKNIADLESKQKLIVQS
ncbi:MAG: hypothetical protein HYT65_00215 [Candidatus Yanofskybacteria bacterium]|nr:hypothetical protein [Candidatus Yanofskybacteria bacterium]